MLYSNNENIEFLGYTIFLLWNICAYTFIYYIYKQNDIKIISPFYFVENMQIRYISFIKYYLKLYQFVCILLAEKKSITMMIVFLNEIYKGIDYSLSKYKF